MTSAHGPNGDRSSSRSCAASRSNEGVKAGAIQVNVDATLSGSSLDGTYDAQSAGACSGDTGTFSVKR